MTSKANVATPCPDYAAMVPDWDMIDALRGGTQTMRDAGTLYLPREVKEANVRYERRRDSTFLFPALNNTRKKIVERPFTKATVIAGDIPERMEAVIENMDLAGSSITKVAKWLIGNGVNSGRAHIFVDFKNTGGQQSNLDHITGSARPHFVKIAARDLTYWADGVDSATGEQVFTEVRWKETRSEKDGEWGTKKVEYIRRYVAVEAAGDSGSMEWTAMWELWQKDERGESWTVKEDGPLVWPGGKGLPFFPFNPGVDGDRMLTSPPLRDLAWLNVEHWQASSDRRSALRYAALIMLAAYGITKKQSEEGINLGHGALHGFTDTQAKMEWVEAEGKSIEQLTKDLERIAEAMELEGMQPFMRKRANTTATSQRSNDNTNDAPIQAWVRDANEVLGKAITAAAMFLGVEMPADFAVQIYNEFQVIESGDVEALIKMRENRDIDHGTFLREMQRLGKLSDELEPEKIAEAVADEMEVLGVGSTNPDGPEDDPVADGIEGE